MPLMWFAACGGPTATSSGGVTTDATADSPLSPDVAADVAAEDASGEDGTDAAAADAATDVAALDVPVDAATDATADAGVDADAGDATDGDAAATDAGLQDAVADATDADAPAADAAVDGADADAAATDVDAGPTPLGLNADVTLTAPAEGVIVNVGDVLAVSFAVTAPQPAGQWAVTVALGAGATATEAFDALPLNHTMLATVVQAGLQTVTLGIWQDGVLVAQKTAQIVGNLAPTGTPQLAIAPAPATVQADLQASLAQPSIDPEGAALTWTWTWLLNGQPTTFVAPTVPAQWLKKGQKWTVTAVASDGHAAGPLGTADVVIANSAPTAVVLSAEPATVDLTGTVTATVLTESSDPDGDLLTTKFAWTWQGQLIGETATLTVPTVLVNGQHLVPGELQLRVTAVDSDGAATVTKQSYAIVSAPVCGTPWWTCDAHANCEDDGTLTPPCTCQGGWLGDGKTCLDIDECGGNPCDANAKCVNSPGSFSCSCVGGFTGNGFSCTDVNECKDKTDNCSKLATCANTDGGFTCTCLPGYGGSGQQCADIDECATKTANCDGNATCTNSVGGFTCNCNAGWQGSGTSCSDVNECADPALNACDGHADCLNSDGGYDCTCKSGWSGSGLTCTDVDECALGTAGCDSHAKCANSEGSFSCTCNAGFSGTGKTCTDTNECTAGTAICDGNATCGNTEGSYVCACNPGYIGDGKTCAAVCDLYCAAVTANCTGGNQQYADLATCQATCKTNAAWAVGKVGDSAGDTAACRYTQATSASLAPGTFCGPAGASGGGVCGSECDGYCDLMLHSCPGAYASAPDCQTACAALPANGAVGATTGNSLQCRATYALQGAGSAANCIAAGAVSGKCASAIDVSGWKIEQTVSTQSFTFPAGTTIPSGGYLILSRASAKADFEAFWGVTLAANVTFLQSAAIASATTACPQINGDESYTLKRADGTVVDGPTVAMTASGKFIFNRTDPTQGAGVAAAWTASDYNVKTNATPGAGETSGKVNGAYISEFADAAGTNNFVYEYVEVYVDPGM